MFNLFVFNNKISNCFEGIFPILINNFLFLRRIGVYKLYSWVSRLISFAICPITSLFFILSSILKTTNTLPPKFFSKIIKTRFHSLGC